jgi:hypothetical protein
METDMNGHRPPFRLSMIGLGLAGFLLAGFGFMMPAPAAGQEAPHVRAAITMWLENVAFLREATERHLAGDTKVSRLDYAHLAVAFIDETVEVAAGIKVREPGNDAACILSGIALDLNARLDDLKAAASAATEHDVLAGVDQLLREAELIFASREVKHVPAGPSHGLSLSPAGFPSPAQLPAECPLEI